MRITQKGQVTIAIDIPPEPHPLNPTTLTPARNG
jgi:hypothetical protein